MSELEAYDRRLAERAVELEKDDDYLRMLRAALAAPDMAAELADLREQVRTLREALERAVECLGAYSRSVAAGKVDAVLADAAALGIGRTPE